MKELLKKFLVFVFALPILLQPLYGAITPSDNSFNGAGTVSSIDIILTNNASANTLLVAAVQAANATLTNRSATSAKFGGTSLTLIARCDNSTGQFQISTWYLKAPVSGSNHLVITTGGSASALSVVGSTWAGVSQGTLPDAFKTNGFTSTLTPSITNTDVAAGCLLIDNYIKNLVSGSVTIPATQTKIVNANVGAAYTAVQSYQLNVGSGTNIFNYSNSTSSSGEWIIASFPPAATTNVQPELTLTGGGQ